MSDETNAGAEGSGGGGASQKALSTEEIVENERKLKLFDKLDSRYKNDPTMRKVVDHVLSGKEGAIDALFSAVEAKQEEKKQEIKTAEAAGDTSLVTELQKQVKELGQQLNGLKDFAVTNDKIQARSGVNHAYQAEFERMARAAGFTRDYKGWDELFDFTTKEANRIADSFGLYVEDAHGNKVPDLLLGFKQDLLQKAFEVGKGRLENLGFDIAETKRREMIRRNNDVAEAQRAEVLKNFKPNMSKAERGAAYNKIGSDLVRKKNMGLGT